MTKDIFLSVKDVSKSYSGIFAVENASIDFFKGEVHALVGANGAGKSTLIKILAGLVKKDNGSFSIDSKECKIENPKDSKKNGLSFIHQELNLVSHFSAEENIFLGHKYPKNITGTIDWKKLREESKNVFGQLGIDVKLKIPVSKLPIGSQSMVAIAKCFTEKAKIYFMDEPTASLNSIEKENLFKLINHLKSMGSTIVYISHHLDEIIQICDRVTVMLDGKTIGTYEVAGLTKNKIIELMIGKKLQSIYPKRAANIFEGVSLNVSHMSNNFLKNISFDLKKGEIFGIASVIATEASSVLKTLYGAEKRFEGSVTLENKTFTPFSPKHAVKNKLILVPEERRTEGLCLDHSIYYNISLMYIYKYIKNCFIDFKKLNKDCAEKADKMLLKASSYKDKAGTLSGGNQQKVMFAKTLLQKPRVLMLSEPTKGVDVGARYEIYKIINSVAEDGTPVIISSSDMAELIGLCDRILVISNGQGKNIINTDGLTEERLIQMCYGK